LAPRTRSPRLGVAGYLISTDNLDGSSLAKVGTGCLMTPPTSAISSVLGTRWKGGNWERVGLGPLTGNLHDPTSRTLTRASLSEPVHGRPPTQPILLSHARFSLDYAADVRKSVTAVARAARFT